MFNFLVIETFCSSLRTVNMSPNGDIFHFKSKEIAKNKQHVEEKHPPSNINKL